MLEMICDYLDVWSISRLEQCCHLLRGLVVENKLYRRRVKKIVCLRNPDEWIQEEWEDQGDTLEQNSRYYKSKLFGYEYRYPHFILLVIWWPVACMLCLAPV